MYSIRPSSLHQPRCHSLSHWHVIYTLCPLAPCCLLGRLEPYTAISLSIFSPWRLSFIIFLLFTWNVSLCLVLFKCLTVTRFQCCISLWHTHRSAVCASKSSDPDKTVHLQHGTCIQGCCSGLRLFVHWISTDYFKIQNNKQTGET